MNGPTRATKIRQLSYANMLILCDLLDVNDCWKEMIGHICNRDGRPRYNDLQAKIFEKELRAGRSPAKSLLNDWMTSNATVDDLLKVLCAAQLKNVMEYARVNILKESLPDEHDSSASNLKPSVEGLPCISSLTISDSIAIIGDSANSAEQEHVAHVCGSDSESFLSSSPGVRADLQYWQLQRMCDNFNDRPLSVGGRLLGRGGFGSVYLGITSNGDKYAVKKLNSRKGNLEQMVLQFERELQVLGTCCHANLLGLVNFVQGADINSCCIVYEFMPNGSLEDRLALKGGTAPLSAGLRHEIATGAAAGISYLHSFQASPIVHRDIKSANILLDAQYVAKVGDFGLAKLIPADATNVLTSTVIGTTCYMPMESLQYKVTPKWDVYSFGMVLLEVLTGLPAMDTNREEPNLYRHVMENVDGDNIIPLVDKKTDWNKSLANKIFQVALDCLAMEYHKRPEMAKVHHLLDRLVVSS